MLNHAVRHAAGVKLTVVVFVGVVLYIAIKDRRTPDDDHQSPAAGATDEKSD